MLFVKNHSDWLKAQEMEMINQTPHKALGWPSLDFLTNPVTFSSISNKVILDRGCVQGFVLRPINSSTYNYEIQKI